MTNARTWHATAATCKAKSCSRFVFEVQVIAVRHRRGDSRFTGRGAWFSGMRQVVIGAAAAAVTYSLGKVIGVGLGS